MREECSLEQCIPLSPKQKLEFKSSDKRKLFFDDSSSWARLSTKIRHEYAHSNGFPLALLKSSGATRSLIQSHDNIVINFYPDFTNTYNIDHRNFDCYQTSKKSHQVKISNELSTPIHENISPHYQNINDSMNSNRILKKVTNNINEKVLNKSSSTFKQEISSTRSNPVWHAPWKCYRVICGHLGWVRAIAFDPTNEWFCSGSSDRTIKIWDMASGELKLTLTGHIEQVTGLAVSPHRPYMFSCGLDKMVKCWDLEYNKVIRSYHGHLSGLYSLALHPVLDLLFTGGRDAVCRVWDIRTKIQIDCLSGHSNTLASVLALPTDPQVITGSHDSTIRLWDLRNGKTQNTLTFTKKGVRALLAHPKDRTFCSASADNIKKFRLPKGDFLHNTIQQHRCIVNTLAVNEDGVMASGGDNGSIWFWDYSSGNCFQHQQTVVQPGSLHSESGIFASAFDITGSRFVTCEADKTIKMWKEDASATPETHPVIFKPISHYNSF